MTVLIHQRTAFCTTLKSKTCFVGTSFIGAVETFLGKLNGAFHPSGISSGAH